MRKTSIVYKVTWYFSSSPGYTAPLHVYSSITQFSLALSSEADKPSLTIVARSFLLNVVAMCSVIVVSVLFV